MTDKKIKFVFPVESDKPRLVTWPCTINVPVDGGGQEKQELTVRYRLVDGDEISKLAAGGEGAIFDAIVDGFVDLAREGGGAVTDDEARTLFRKLPYARAGILFAYYDMLSGRPLKN